MKKPTWVEFYHTIQCCYASTCIYILSRLLSPTSATSPTLHGVVIVIKSYTGNFALISARHYKFYIAFENGDCDDYITEKFFRTLKDVSPDHSF